jgi:hypothetical protein
MINVSFVHSLLDITPQLQGQKTLLTLTYIYDSLVGQSLDSERPDAEILNQVLA